MSETFRKWSATARASASPADAILTPSARDLLARTGNQRRRNGATAAATRMRFAESPTNFRRRPKKLNSKSPKSELEAFFNSPYAQQLEGADLRDGPSPLAARLRGRQRRQHRHPRRRGHRPLHAHAGQQRLAQAGGHVPGGLRGQPACSAPRSAPAKF